MFTDNTGTIRAYIKMKVDPFTLNCLSSVVRKQQSSLLAQYLICLCNSSMVSDQILH